MLHEERTNDRPVSIEAEAPSAARLGVTEPIDTERELAFWRAAHEAWPTVRALGFGDLEPAYRLAIETYALHPDLSFDEAEDLLRVQWPRVAGNQQLGWCHVRAPSREAWERLARAHRTVASDLEEKAAKAVADLIALLHESAARLRSAADSLRNPAYRDGVAHLASEHEQFIRELRPLAERGGASPATGPRGSRAIDRLWSGFRAALGRGDAALMGECQEAEDHSLRAYRDLLARNELPPGARSMVGRQLNRVVLAHDVVTGWKRASR